jgi:HEAT repeat protein
VELPPDDQPDTIDIGPIKGIPVFHDDDPRLEGDRARWSAAARLAQAMHSVDDLLAGLGHDEWRVRQECVPRLAARGKADTRTVPALLTAVIADEVWQVRDTAVMALLDFNCPEAKVMLRLALDDVHPDVRWSAEYVLHQLHVD